MGLSYEVTNLDLLCRNSKSSYWHKYYCYIYVHVLLQQLDGLAMNTCVICTMDNHIRSHKT